MIGCTGKGRERPEGRECAVIQETEASTERGRATTKRRANVESTSDPSRMGTAWFGLGAGGVGYPVLTFWECPLPGFGGWGVF